MLTLIALVVFVLVALLVFAVGSFLDQRSAQARLLRDRLATVQKAEQQTNEELALLRDEMMSKIPALDSLLRRSERMANFQIFLEQADLKVRAGNILLLCVVSAVVVGVIGYFVAGSLPPNQAVLFVMVGLVLGANSSLFLRFLPSHQALSEVRRIVSRMPSIPWPGRCVPATPSPLRWS